MVTINMGPWLATTDWGPEVDMAEKFDPAPLDKHAADPKAAMKVDREVDEHLEAVVVLIIPSLHHASRAMAA